MKHPNPRIALLALGAVAAAGFIPTLASAQTTENRKPIVITMPAVQDGSNTSRAPFIAERRFDDTQRADGKAIDSNVPPNTPATDQEPNPLPPPTVAILQPAPAPAIAAPDTAIAATATVDPTLTPTGRNAINLSATVDSNAVVPTIRSGMYETREQVATDIESRLKASEQSLVAIRTTSAEMSADGRKQFKAADDDVKERAKALNKSIKAARKANATEWEAARSQLAADYEAYAMAVARVDATAR